MVDNAYAISWVYDAVGNRLTQVKDGVSTSSTYNARNQLATATTGTVQKSYSYDNNGNNVHVGTYDGGVLTGEVNMAYDVLNRQTYWGDGTSTETHSYAGAEWHRVSTTVNSSNTVHYIYDGDNVVADSDGTNLTKLYVTPFLDQNVAMYDVTNPAAIGKHYYSQDGLGSVRTVTDVSGAVENSYDFTAFGETYSTNTTESVSQRYTYMSQELDPVSNLMYNNYRHYHPGIGIVTMAKLERKWWLIALQIWLDWRGITGTQTALQDWRQVCAQVHPIGRTIAPDTKRKGSLCINTGILGVVLY